MQTGFDTSHHVLPICTKVLQQAIIDGAFIAIAQYYRFGKTHPELTRLLKGVSHTQYGFCLANKNDKESSITRLLYDRNIRVSVVYVCGVNTGACVRSTVDGLACNHPEKTIIVLSDVCSDVDISWHQYALSQMTKNYHNVILDKYART